MGDAADEIVVIHGSVLRRVKDDLPQFSEFSIYGSGRCVFDSFYLHLCQGKRMKRQGKLTQENLDTIKKLVEQAELDAWDDSEWPAPSQQNGRAYLEIDSHVFLTQIFGSLDDIDLAFGKNSDKTEEIKRFYCLLNRLAKIVNDCVKL